MRRLLLAALCALTAVPVVSDAQVWKPRGAPRPRKRPKRRPVPVPLPVPDPVAEEPVAEPELEPEPEPEPEEIEDPEEIGHGQEHGYGHGPLRIEDDLDDVGAKVTFSEADLATDAADGAGDRRLETRALGFARAGVDTIHDPPPAVTSRLHGAGEDIVAFRAHGRAESTSRFRDRFKVKVAGRADAELGFDSDTQIGVERYEAEIWDTYADAYFSWLDLRFGKQIVAWGTSDLLSPNDVVNPRDLRRGLALEPDELRLPVLGLSARAFSGPLSLQGLWIPVAPQHRFDLLDGDHAILGPHAATPTERRIGALVSALATDPTFGPAVSPIASIGGDPGNGIDSGELGAAGSIETRAFDVHAYFLWGHERTPEIAIDPALRQFLLETPAEMLTPEVLGERLAMLAAAGAPAVQVAQPRRLHIGAAAATRIEPLGLKLDAAWSPAATAILAVEGAGPVLGEPVRLPQLAATASVDYDRGSELSVIAEVSHLRVLDVPDGRTVYQMRGDHVTLVGGRVAWNPGAGPVTLSGLGFVDVDGPSYAIRPAVELSGHDHWSVEIAATLYGGPPGTMGGVPDDADEVTLTVQYGL